MGGNPAQAATIFILVSIALVLGIGYVIWAPIYNIFFHPLRKVPGPWLHAATGLPRFRIYTSGHAHHDIHQLHEKYGDVVRIAPDEVSFTSPRAWREIMGFRKESDGENGKDEVFYRNITSPQSILRKPRADHTRIRRIIGPAFSGQAVVDQEAFIKPHIDLLIQRLHEKCDDGRNPLDMVKWLNWTTFDITGELAFGESFGCLQDSGYHPWVKLIVDTVKLSAFEISLKRLPIMSRFINYKVPEDLAPKLKWHQEMSTEKVRQRISLGAERPDFVEPMLTKGSGADQKKMTFDEIRGTAQTIIVAGSETSATALSAALFYLISNPATLEELNKEIRTSFASDDRINFSSTQKLPYLSAVINEALRMHPPTAVGFPRQARPGGVMICDYYMPEKTTLGICHWAMFRNSRNFTLPDSFRPERWLDDPNFVNDHLEAFNPFSYGSRNCIGKNFALAEMKTILARVIWNFDMKLDADARNWIDQETYWFWSKGPLNVMITPRK